MQHLPTQMTPLEWRASFGLASLYGLRLLGMFLLLPIFALYAPTLEGGGNPLWIGITLGAYGATQFIMQLPFGLWSDRFGRKKIIQIGLVLLLAGSLIAALAPNIYWMAIGRALQGAGAVSAAIMALLADLTREEIRTRAMAIIGMSIGLTFSISLVLGPLLAQWIGLQGIFYLTAILALLGMLATWKLIPNPMRSQFHSDASANQKLLPQVIRNGQLLRLNFGIFALHAAQMAMFIAMPAMLVSNHVPKNHHWYIYLPVVLLGFALMVPFIIYAETRHRLKPVFCGAIALMLITQLGMVFSLHHLWLIAALLVTYFMAFNLLEASLPSLISKIAPAAAKGTAMGVYNASQSLGLATGAILGGWLYKHGQASAVFMFGSGLMFIWFIIALSMKTPPAVRTKMYHLDDVWLAHYPTLQQKLSTQAGVKEVTIIPNEQIIYLKISPREWDETTTLNLLQEPQHGKS